MPRFFNTTGPCDPRQHYMLPAEARSPGLLALVERAQYFVLHAPRQVGKTTAMRAFAERLRGLGYAAVWATLETSQGLDQTADTEPLWIASIADRASVLAPADRPPDPHPALVQSPGRRLLAYLRAWSEQTPLPIVLLLDEADVVSGQALISMLRQLRDGFVDRGPGSFPVSVGLIGMRDLRDYLTEAKGGVRVNPGSPFNIKAASITLRNFRPEECAALLAQHTDDTGQPFLPDAIEQIYTQSGGHPFLVNALAAAAIEEADAAPIGRVHIDRAVERLIRARTTHLDSLGQRLAEPRVARILQPILLGDEDVETETDDFQYTVDLGLVHPTLRPPQIANPLYREVLARQLTLRRQENLNPPWWRWQRPDGGLDFPALINAFLDWWRNNEGMIRRPTQGYPEATAHITFMAFLQRVVNGGGQIQRELAAGRGAVDLVVDYAGERFVVEMKRVRPDHDALETVREQGALQLSAYLDSLGHPEGWLLLFDQRPGRPWSERLWREDRLVNGHILHLIGA
jgi:hypothetical protein